MLASQRSSPLVLKSPNKRKIIDLKPATYYRVEESEAENSSDFETEDKQSVDGGPLDGLQFGILNRSVSPEAQSSANKKLSYDSIYYKLSKTELIQMLTKQKDQLKVFTVKSKDDTDLIDRMRHDYLKELANLREQILSKDKSKKFEYIEVHYFEPSEGLNQQMCFVLNNKLDEMKDLYERSLERLQLTNFNLQKQINLFLKLGEDGNIGIKFNEMNADAVIRKLQKIEKDPRVIWKAFDEYYGYGFFFDVLEYEFGITPETHHKLIEKFDTEIAAYKNVANTHITSISEKTQNEIDRLRKELEDKNLEMSMIKQKHLVDMDRLKKDIAEAMEVKNQGQLAA